MYKKIMKPSLDILFCIISLPIFLVLYIIIGLLIKLEDGGPVFFKAERIGLDFKLYSMYKFRTMKVNAPLVLNEDGSTFNSNNDSRVTKVGKILRETSLDEIPQILNVLKGNMSIIGPRASLGSVIDTFKNDEIDKMKVKPGITGYSQAYFRNNASNREKRLKDAWYANNVTAVLDFKILVQTFRTIINKDGLYTNK